MLGDRFVAADVWLSNADVDLQVASELADRFPSRACFHAQQAAELVLKAALIVLADAHPRIPIRGMLIDEIMGSGCDVPTHVASAADRLDAFYLGARYPDALAGADPSKVLQKSDAVLAVEEARSVFVLLRNW